MHPEATQAGVAGAGGRQPPLADPRRSETPESAGLARALALKLGCRRIGLIGTAREPMLRGLGDGLELIELQLDEPAAWSTDGLAGALLLIDARLLLADSEALERLVTAAVAAVLIDPDGGLGIDSLGALVRSALDAGLTVEHRSLVRSPDPGARRRESPYVVVSDGRDARLPFVLAAGARGLALDPDVDETATLDRPARICIASYEVAGPTRNGGIGTANTLLALALAEAGHEVTLLHTGYPGPEGEVDEPHWRRRFARQRVAFELLAAGTASSVRAPHANVRRAYELYQWLRERDGERPFDVVHFPECQGHGYYAVLAKRHGLAFAQTLFVAGVHSSTRWCAEANRELPRSIDALVDEHLERVSVEFADVLISPSAYMLDYIEERGWRLPRRRFVQQYVLPATARIRPGVEPHRRARAIDEIVFFGRLEVRKGIETFCDALDRVAELSPERKLEVTFLGRPEHVRGEPAIEYVARRAERWPWPYRVLGDLDRNQAMALLRRGNCLAVMPSSVDNLPNTVIEVLSLRIPMIASRGGGTGELIDPLDLLDATVPGLEPERSVAPTPAERVPPAITAGPLAERILAALAAPVVPEFAIDHEANERTHVGWHAGAVAAMRRDPAPAAPDNPQLTISVGVVDCDGGRALGEALAALEEQSRPPLDVVVVTDAGASEASAAALAAAEDVCRRRGWTLIRRGERDAARAREALLAEGRGELVVLLRCSEVLLPGALATIQRVAARSRADVYAWPTRDQETVVVPIGGPALAGLLYPAFTTGPYAITRAALERLRGFAPDVSDDDADHDLLNRAALGTCMLELIPEPLSRATAADAWAGVRSAPTIELGRYDLDREQAIRIARPFAALAPEALIDLPGLQLTLHAKVTDERRRTFELVKEIDSQRHKQAEYIAYLESEHHRLSDAIHDLQATVGSSPYRRVRRVLGRIGRRLRARASSAVASRAGRARRR